MVLIGLERQDILGFNIGCTIGQDILYFTICGLIATERYSLVTHHIGLVLSGLASGVIRDNLGCS